MLLALRALKAQKGLWALLAGFVLGGGSWSTHFVAMLGYAPEVPASYDLAITLGSAALGIFGATIGILVWARARGLVQRGFGGTVVGSAIIAMHYLGMTGLRVPGSVLWQPDLVAASIAWGIVASTIGFALLRPGRRIVRSVLFVVLAVAGLHALGTAAGVLLLDPGVASIGAALPRAWLAGLVAGVTLLWLGTGIAVQLVQAQQRRQQRLAEAQSIRALADAALEAIALCDADGRITDVNQRLCTLLDTRPEQLIGRPVAELISAEAGVAGTSCTGTLGGRIPVELMQRDIETAAGRRTVYALHDLRQQIASQDRISHLARHDPLTGAANRASLQEELEKLLLRAPREGFSFVLFYIDLDQFKPVNDLHGHAQGDRVLTEVVQRLRSQARRGDLVARLGGDEFVVLAPSIATHAEAMRIAERLIGLLQIDVEGVEGGQPVTASIGFALYPADGTTAEALLHAADLAMYRAKRDSGNGFAAYHAALDEELRQARLLEMDVRQAAVRGELKLEFQPFAATPGPDVIGFEALVRWDHPERGRVPPDRFIGVAETCGAILSIGEWVLRTACREAAGWTKPLTVAVNVSPMQVQHAGFAAKVEEILAETGLPPCQLELEVTETLFIAEPARVTATLSRLRALGVRIALDDFGIGYSSLATLRNFPFDKIKIDRSFIGGLGSDAQAEAIVRGVLGLAHGLGLPVVAEGVESAYQLERLKAEGCTAVQGYLIGRPRPISSYGLLTGNAALAAE